VNGRVAFVKNESNEVKDGSKKRLGVKTGRSVFAVRMKRKSRAGGR